MKIGITSDTHGDLYFRQIYKSKREGYSHLIVCGDFGYIWDGSIKEQRRLDYLNKIGVQVLFIDGNHENHALLNKYPISKMYGGRVHKIRDNIIHLIRGEIYEINGKSVFAFGGANSVDKSYYDIYGNLKHRIEGKDWWREEKPSEEDKLNAHKNLEKYNFEVDYIITHTCYPFAIGYVGGNTRADDVSDYLNYIRHSVKFKYWYFGHMHTNCTIGDFNTKCLYKNIVELDI